MQIQADEQGFRTFRNNRNNDTIKTPLTNGEALESFSKLHGQDDDHWLWFWLHKMAKEAKDSASQPSKGTAIQFICDSFVVAIGYSLKRPMLRVHYKDQRFKIYLSQKGTLCLKSGRLTEDGSKDPEGNEQYVGCFLRGGFLPTKNYGVLRKMSETEQDFLNQLSDKPVEFLAKCSKDMCQCCYCGLPLEDETSKTVGYGAICAKHWGLPWSKDKSYMEKAPSFAKSHTSLASDLCNAIRDGDELAWDIFGDWLEGQGLPRSKKPASGVVLPRNDSNLKPVG